MRRMQERTRTESLKREKEKEEMMAAHVCYVVYIGADNALSTSEWHENDPALNVQALGPEASAVRRLFTKPHIYRVGAHTGCGCSFFYDFRSRLSEEDTEDEEENRKSAHALVALLKANLVDSATMELLVHWEGTREKERIRKRVLSPDDLLLDTHFDADENDFITLSGGASNGCVAEI
jgi:hypothetical protein